MVKEKGYKNTSFRYTYPNSIKQRIYFFIMRVIRKVFHKTLVQFSNHYGELRHFINKNKFDLVIAEGGEYRLLGEICNKYPSNRMLLHLHHHYRPDIITSRFYGNIMGVSEYVTKEYKETVKNEKIRTYVLKNAIDTSNFKNKKGNTVEREELGFRQDDFIVLYVGRIIDIMIANELVGPTYDIIKDKKLSHRLKICKLKELYKSNFTKNAVKNTKNPQMVHRIARVTLKLHSYALFNFFMKVWVRIQRYE